MTVRGHGGVKHVKDTLRESIFGPPRPCPENESSPCNPSFPTGSHLLEKIPGQLIQKIGDCFRWPNSGHRAEGGVTIRTMTFWFLSEIIKSSRKRNNKRGEVCNYFWPVSRTASKKVYFFSKINLSPGLMFRQHKNSPGSHTFSGSHGGRGACVMLIWNNAPLSIVIHSTHCLGSGGEGTLWGLVICSHTRTAFPSLPLSHHPPVLAFPGNCFPGGSWWIFLFLKK